MPKTRPPDAGDILQGTLDLLILRTLILGPAHGHTIAHSIEQTSENALEVEQGSLYPALHRLEDRGLVASEWGVERQQPQSKVLLGLTAKGRKELNAATSRWRRDGRAPSVSFSENRTAKREEDGDYAFPAFFQSREQRSGSG